MHRFRSAEAGRQQAQGFRLGEVGGHPLLTQKLAQAGEPAQVLGQGHFPHQRAQHQLVVFLAALLRAAGIAIAHQLLHLAAPQPLQPTLQIDREALAFVAVAKGAGGVGGDAAEAIHQAAQGGSTQHQIAIWTTWLEPHQAAHRVGDQGGAAQSVEAANALGTALAGDLHRQIGRHGEHLQRPLGIDPQQQQGIGIGGARRGRPVEGIGGAFAIQADHQHGDTAAWGFGQVGWGELLDQLAGAVSFGPDPGEQAQPHSQASTGHGQSQQHRSPAALRLV